MPLITISNIALSGKIQNHEFRKQHSIPDPLVALKISRQTRPGLVRGAQTTEDFF
jgi:hypothetical protein